MSVRRNVQLAPKTAAVEVPRCSCKGHLLGTPMEEARGGIFTDIARGQWQFFATDPHNGVARVGAGSHRR